MPLCPQSFFSTPMATCCGVLLGGLLPAHPGPPWPTLCPLPLLGQQPGLPLAVQSRPKPSTQTALPPAAQACRLSHTSRPQGTRGHGDDESLDPGQPPEDGQHGQPCRWQAASRRHALSLLHRALLAAGPSQTSHVSLWLCAREGNRPASSCCSHLQYTTLSRPRPVWHTGWPGLAHPLQLTESQRPG